MRYEQRKTRLTSARKGNAYNGGAGTWQSTTSYWQPSSTTYWQPSSTTYQQPASTVYVQPQGVTVTQQPQYTTTASYHGGGGFCSTVYETGPNLPTQAQGQCGTILIAKAGASRSVVWSGGVVMAALVGGVGVFAWSCLG